MCSTLHCFNYYLPAPMCPSTPTLLDRVTDKHKPQCLMPDVVMPQSQEPTTNQKISQPQITIHITLKDNQYLTNTNTNTNTHWPTPTDKNKIKPNLKSQKKGKQPNINKIINYCYLIVSLICLSFINYNLLYCCFINYKIINCCLA